MSNFTLHLGFNWNSPAIGAFWSNAAIAENGRFLQYALSDQNAAPAWFQFASNDAIAVDIWDLSSSSAPIGDLVLALSMAFSPLDANSGSAYVPSTLVDAQGTATQATQQVQGSAQPFLKFDAISSAQGKSSPWGACRGHYTAGSLKMSAASSYKLSFCLRVGLSGSGEPTRVFVSDPEVIVGSRGG